MTRNKADDLSDHPLVVAVCSFRIKNVRRHLRHNVAQLSGDEYLVVLDLPMSIEVELATDEVQAAGGTMCILGATGGLSRARNVVLASRPHHFVLFIDDEVVLDAAAVAAIRQSFRDGAHVVGARLSRPPKPRVLPWYITPGQFHLLGWHRDQAEIKIWGGCMGVDAAFARRHGLAFDPALGRNGGNLLGGEDTSFIKRMKEAGARERLLPQFCVVHDVARSRLRLRNLLRRAYWLGRSEVRRNAALAGLRKEWNRHRTAPESSIAWVLACLYVAATATGIAHELLRPFLLLRSRRRETPADTASKEISGDTPAP